MWSLSAEDRRRLILSSLRDRYELAMEKLKCCMKHYNLLFERYEVTIFSIKITILQLWFTSSPLILTTIPVLPPPLNFLHAV